MTIDIIILIFIGFLAFQGYRKGFIKTIFDTLGIIISFFISKELFHFTEKFLLNNTKLFVKLHDYFELKLSENILSNIASSVPEGLQRFINDILSSEVSNTFDALVDNFSLLVIRSVSFIITFLIIYAILLFLANLLNTVMKLPLLNLTNRVFGGITGILKGLVLLYLIFALATPLLGFMQDRPLAKAVLNSESSKIFYDNNILLNYLSYNGFYER